MIANIISKSTYSSHVFNHDSLYKVLRYKEGRDGKNKFKTLIIILVEERFYL